MRAGEGLELAGLLDLPGGPIPDSRAPWIQDTETLEAGCPEGVYFTEQLPNWMVE